MTDNLITELKARIKRLIRVPSDGGRFEVNLDGAIIYSKLESGRFPEYEDIRKHLVK